MRLTIAISLCLAGCSFSGAPTVQGDSGVLDAAVATDSGSVDSPAIDAPVSVNERLRTWSANNRGIGGVDDVGSASVAVDDAALEESLFVVAVSAKEFEDVPKIDTVTGLGFNWVRVGERCGARAQAGVSLWVGLGVPAAPLFISAALNNDEKAATIAVAQYTAVTGQSVGDSVEVNGDGSTDCNIGSDDSSDEDAFSFDLLGVEPGSMIIAAVAIRQTTVLQSSLTTVVAENSGAGGSDSGVALFEQLGGASGTVTIETELSGAADWSAVAFEFR